MHPLILRQNPEAEYYMEEGCFILENSNTPDDPEVSIARARLLPGTSTRWHRLHNIVERYLILSGTGIVEIGDLPPTPVHPGDVVIIPAGVRQRIHNPDTTQDLQFYCICTPRFQPEYYEDL